MTRPLNDISWTLVTPPAEEPVTTEDAKRQCRVDADEEADLIDLYISSSRIYLEERYRRAFVTQTWRLTMDRFPCHGWRPTAYGFQAGDEWWRDRRIQLPRPPLAAVSSITYVDQNGTTQTLAADQYVVDNAAEPGRILPAYGLHWPITREQPVAVTVNYTAGYGAASVVPAPIKHAILLLVEHAFSNRGPVNIGNITTKLDFSVDSMMGPYKVYGRCT